MSKRKKTEKPWLDHRGRELTTEQLREISKNWDLETWKRYGDSLELEAEGKSLRPGEFRKLEDQQIKNIFSANEERSSSLALTRQVAEALKCLSLRQSQVIKEIFYHGKSTEETARELGLSKTTVHDHKKHAISKLRWVLSVSPNAVAAYEGVSDLESESQTPLEELLDVMNKDISRTDSSRHDFDKGDRE